VSRHRLRQHDERRHERHRDPAPACVHRSTLCMARPA
jgi:hypothetical protein